MFDEEKARRDATNNFALAWLNSQKLAASIGDWRQQECSKNAPVWATVDVEAVFKNDLGIPQYPPLVLLQLDVLPFYELIIKSPAAALQQYGHRDCRTLPSLSSADMPPTPPRRAAIPWRSFVIG